MAHRFSPRVRFNPETVETSFGGTQLPGHIKESSVLSDDSRHSIDSFVVNKTEKAKTPTSKSKTSRSLDSPSPFKTPISKTDPEHRFITPTKTSLQYSEHFRTPSKKRSADILKHTSQTPDYFNTVTIETPQSTQRQRHSDELLMSEDCGITVAVRVRPFSAREKDDPETRCVVSMVDNETIVTTERGDVHRFAYDYSFWSFDEKSYDFAGQEHVYQSLAQPMLGTMFEGYNTCLFAYGQTGSGKSYSIMGHNKEVGIIPRFCEELFGRVTLEKRESQVNVEISYFEIYNEKIHDLLAPSTKDKTGRKTNLKVREHPTMGPYVEELSSYVVESFEDINGWLNVGNKHRATAATWMNDKSSRSHSVFTMILTQTKTDLLDGESHIHTITSKINLVDLAGSERQSVAKTSGDRLREGASINKSLMTLGKVISLLCEYSMNSSSKKKKLFIPYRDSVLTWLLKESLGGNSKTAMLATISPANIHIEETLSTLRYAQQARYIINTARVNEDPKARLIRELRAEIDKLRNQGGFEDGNLVQVSSTEIDALRQKLAAKEKEMAEKERSWRDRLKKSEEQKKEESRLLERLGIAFKVDNNQPNLVNLNEDPQLCEMLLYVLKEGQTKVGREGACSDIDIQLFGPLIADEHCVFNYDHNKVTVTPLGDALTYVNGNQITQRTVLHHNDRVILGGDHYFRFCHPSEVTGQRKSQVSGAPMDFEFARQELIRVQDARLEAELEQARRNHQCELEKELARKELEAQQRMEEELSRTKREADEKLRAQRREYESKLSEKERLVRDQRKKQFESEQQRQEAEEAIKKLQEQIMVLEQEVLANRKCVEMETKAAQEVMKVSHISHSEIVEYLEKENQQIQQQIKELTARRQQKREARVNLPRDTPKTSSSQDCSKKDLFKLTLKIQEANKLSQHMNKCTVFSREEAIIDNIPQTVIKVTRTKLDISTLWTVEKFENRLAQMRELYQLTYSDDSPCEVEDIFYDPNDTWEKGVKLNTPNGMSPRVLRGLRRQASNNTPTRVLFDSLSTPTSRGSRQTSSQGSPDGVDDSASPGTESLTTDSEMGDVQPTIGEMCQKQITDTLKMYRGSCSQQVAVDKMLSQCNVVSCGVHLLRDTYNSWRENKQDRDSMYKLRQVLHSQPLMLTVSVHVIFTSVELWSAHLKQFNSVHANQLYEQLVTTIRRLANQLVLFLQGCENDLDSMVSESSEKMFDALYLACRLAGEIAMATETPLSSLQDAPCGSSILDEDTKSALSYDIKHAVLSGCEVFVDRTLSVSINTAEDCHRRMIGLANDILPQATLTEEMRKQIEVVVSASCEILSKLEQSQVRRQRREISADICPPSYHHRIYIQNEELVKNIVSLTDTVSLLVEISEPLVKDKDDISLHRIMKCINMICSTSEKIISPSGGSSYTSVSIDSQLDSSDVSVLTDSQLDQLDALLQDIRRALSHLERLIRGSSSTNVMESGDFGSSCSGSPKANYGINEGLISTGGIVRRNRAIFEH